MTQPWPNWAGETAVIVATGPSAADIDLSIVRGKARFLAIKDGWRLCPWADALYGCDHHWWEAHKGVSDFNGIRLAYDKATVSRWPGIEYLKVDIASPNDHRMLFGKIGTVGWGGNSGFHAINLAAQFGAKRILLVGFDMRVDHGKHFFGQHKYCNRPNEKTVAMWRGILDATAPALAGRGIEVINCSPVSALTAFPKLTFEAALHGEFTGMEQSGAQAIHLDRLRSA